MKQNTLLLNRQRQNEQIVIKTINSTERIKYKDVLYIKAKRSYANIYT